MKLRKILSQHSEFHPDHHLANCLGDGYLLSHNQLYREVRAEAVALGFRYSDQADEFYTSLPLSQLDAILEKKCLPYQNNVGVLVSLEKQVPGQIEWDHICDNLKQNHIFHESCHAIARTRAQRLGLPTLAKGNPQFKIALMLLEESFANTCELLAVADADTDIHRLFFETNSYICMFEDRVHFKNALRDFPRAELLRFFILAYFHANFLFEKFLDREFELCLELAFGAHGRPSAQQLKALRALAKNAFALNPRFRFATTGFYLRLNGIPLAVEEALDWDHLQFLTEQPALLSYLQQLTAK